MEMYDLLYPSYDDDVVSAGCGARTSTSNRDYKWLIFLPIHFIPHTNNNNNQHFSSNSSKLSYNRHIKSKWIVRRQLSVISSPRMENMTPQFMRYECLPFNLLLRTILMISPRLSTQLFKTRTSPRPVTRMPQPLSTVRFTKIIITPLSNLSTTRRLCQRNILTN